MAQAVMIPSTDMLDIAHHSNLLTRPEAKRLTQLEREMANVLSRTDLSDKQKLDMFLLTLENYRRVRGEIVNNGLMLTSTTSPQPPLQEVENDDLIKKIQQLIQNITGPQQQTPAPTTSSTPATNQQPPATPAALIKSTPKTYSPILTEQANNLKKDLVNNSTIKHVPKLGKFSVGNDNYATNHINKALVKMTSNDDINSVQPQIRIIAHKIYKQMLQTNTDMTKLAKFKFFNQLAQSTAITPRNRKQTTKSTSSTAAAAAAKNIPSTKASRKRTSTDSASPVKKPKIGNGTLVNFKLWDTI
jgi:hypothetical protein